MTDWIKETDSPFLSSKELGPGIQQFKITDVKDIEFPLNSGIERHALYFQDAKPLLLNKTNMKILIEKSGKNDFTPAKLIGKTVSLMRQKVVYQNELVDGLRVVDLA